MGNSDIRQRANQAVLNISRKHAHTHKHAHTVRNRNSRDRITILDFPFNVSHNNLFLKTTICGLVVGVVLVFCATSIYMCKCVYEGMEVSSVYTKPPGNKRDRQRDRKRGRKPWPRWEVQIQHLPSYLTLSYSLHGLSTRMHTHPDKSQTKNKNTHT